jgi:hypothetical protein
MTQSVQASQRLLVTLKRTCSYYNTRPNLLSNHFRNHSGIAVNARPATTGFSIQFADGPLESIIAKPTDSVAESLGEPKRLRKKVAEPRGAKVKVKEKRQQSASTKRNEAEDAGPEPPLKLDNNLALAAKGKKPTTKKEKPGLETRRSAKTESEIISRSEHPAWHETDELEIEAAIESEIEEQHLQRDYPDTRTINEAGRRVRVQPGEEGTQLAPVETGRSPRPLSTYKEPWQVQKAALKNKFVEGWNPRKKLSPDTMEGIRALHAQYPDRYTTPVLAEQFGVSSEAIRRILKSKWRSSLEPEQAAAVKERWARRHDRIWDIKSEIGLRPKRKGAKEIEDPEQFEEELRGRQLLEAYRNA